MTLNRIWIGMFLTGGFVILSKLIFWQDTEIMKTTIEALFSSAEVAFTICLGMTAMLVFWLGIMKIGENAGAVRYMTKIVSPLFSRLFPEVPKEHPAVGAMMMNFSMNMLGLDNAATPMGLKAMKELQTLNPEKEKATNAQIMFLVLNTSGLTIIPVSVFAILAANQDSSPASVFLPILISTYFASLAGLIIVAIRQKINLFNKVVLAYIGTMTALIAALLYYVFLNPDKSEFISNVVGYTLIFVIILSFILLASIKRINAYDSFIEGGKEGFHVAIKIIPFLVAMLAAITVFRVSGCLDVVLSGLLEVCLYIGLSATEWIDAMPVAFMKPLSGSGARAALVDVINTHGVESLEARIAATMQGSTETTMYVLAVYFGSVGIRNSRYAAAVGLLADLIGIIVAIIVSYIFFG
jgi:spore maturation protein SpmA